MLRIDRSKVKWQQKLSGAFERTDGEDKQGRSGKWALFLLPMITVLREGLEAVVFISGVLWTRPRAFAATRLIEPFAGIPRPISKVDTSGSYSRNRVWPNRGL